MIAFPPKFTAAKLKQIARLCGKSRSGTKAAITDRIEDDLQTFKPLAPGTRILSIDLGIRNLAYSLLEVPGTSAEPGAKKKARKTADAASLMPILHAWERLALIPKQVPPRKTKKRKARKTALKEDVQRESLAPADIAELPVSIPRPKSKRGRKAAQEDQVQQEPPAPAAVVELSRRTPKAKLKRGGEAVQEQVDLPTQASAIAALEADPTTTAILIEDFSPTRLSSLAVELILTRLLPLKPDLVLLEQQRFRSQGASSVLEWTLRVNSLESMLYAVFTTLRQLGRWPGGKLEGVVARNVLEFMAVQEGGGASIWSKELKGDNKRIKKDIVGNMLSEKRAVLLGEQDGVTEVAQEYVERWASKGKKRKTVDGAAEGLKKLDDLADCLLQGIAFIRWQENKSRLLAGGVEALQDQMVDDE